MPENTTYAYLGPRPGIAYQQYFFTGRNLRAETLYRATIGPEPMTANEVAEDYDVPVEAVMETIRYWLTIPRSFKRNARKTGTKASLLVSMKLPR